MNEHFGHEVVDSAAQEMHYAPNPLGWEDAGIEKYNLGHALLSDTI